MFRKILETSDIISLQGGNPQYFGKKFQKLFQMEKNPTFNFKICGILDDEDTCIVNDEN